MSKQYPGGLITKTPVIPSGPYETSRASGIWTLDQQAAYAEQGIWPTAGVPGPDAQFNYVTMLLHGDGTNGAQNNTFVDSGLGFSVTRNGNTTQGSFSPYGSNWSNFFAYNATAINFLVSGSVSLSGTFTIEGYVNWDGVGGNANMFTLGDSFQSTGIEVYISGGNWIVYSGNASRITGSAAVVGQWTYIAVTRTGTTVTLYINGVSQGTWTSSATFSGTVKIGAEFYSSTYYSSMSGYISNFRINNTTAINTVPTVPLTAVSGTVLLTCQSNRFIDNSASPLTITVNGTPSVQRFNPFGTATAYSTAVIGGSGYFDGTGDNLSVAANSSNLGTGDFNITFWVYFTSDSGSSVPATNNYNGGSFTNGWYFFGSSGTTMSFGLGDATGTNAISGALSGINAWHYIEATRSGSTLSLYVDGVLAQSKTNTNSGTVSGNVTRIGARYDGTALYFPGYITDFKVVLGTAGNTSNYTPPTAPAAAAGANFLLSMQNGAIFDNAMMNDLETAGNAQISTSVKKYGTGSLAFDGTGDYLVNASSVNLAMNTGNFTIEGWFNRTSGTNNGLFQISTATGGFLGSDVNSLAVGMGPDFLYYYANDSSNASSTITFTNGTWNHFALVRNGTTTTIYYNGVSVGSISDSRNYTGTNLVIGGYYSTTYVWNGYIDDFRITKGYARYTANFTPPTAAFQNIGPN